MTIFPGRYTAQIEGDFVVFLIGMRVNQLHAVNKWFPVTQAMPKMLEELMRQPELGLLGFHINVGWRSVSTTQYWRSFDHLHAYAHARNAAHLPAWAAFNRTVGNDGSVGIWHETYEVKAASYECLYNNMPRFGLAATRTAAHVPATGRLNAAKDRIAKAEDTEA